MKRYIVSLTAEERNELLNLIKIGKCAAYKLTHARILLAVDESHRQTGDTDVEIALNLHVSVKTLQRIRKRCVEDGLDAALNRKKHSRFRPCKIQGEEEAHLTAIACSKPPEGSNRWTLSLLSDRLVELKIVEKISASTVGRALKKTN